MGDELLCKSVDARQLLVGLAFQNGQRLVETPGEVLLDVPDVALDDVLIVEDPLGKGSRALFQQGCFG